MEKRWILVSARYDGLVKKAVNMLSGTISEYISYVLPVKISTTLSTDDLTGNNLLVIGCGNDNPLLQECKTKAFLDLPQKPESYAVYVGENPLAPQNQMIAIAGYDEQGLLYGCMDFCNKYCGDIVYRHGDIWSETFFVHPFDRKLNSWKTSVSPAIQTRAIWTWGHVIYDYRQFFDNMVRLRLNEIVIWNDCAPLNAAEVVTYAHSLGIKVIWGFAWGWNTDCEKMLNELNEQSLATIKSSVLLTYEKEYADTGADGIYFQSFTELHQDNVGGKCVAELVTDLVNDVSTALLEKYPSLHIQFGLHATSVKTHLDVLRKVDPRIHIIWEDCGAFPYNYSADEISGFDETLTVTKSLLSLRGENERFGAVLKGLLKLDWNNFEHFSAPYILGERSSICLKKRQADKTNLWKITQAGWLGHAEYARKIISLMEKEGNTPIVQFLVEDSVFENEIMLPVALFAEMLWNPDADIHELTEQVAKYPCVSFASLY